MKRMALLLALVALSPAAAQEVDEATRASIAELLAAMQCEVAPDDIERDDNGYELDDVFCADGQYDMKLDPQLNVTEKRKE